MIKVKKYIQIDMYTSIHIDIYEQTEDDRRIERSINMDRPRSIDINTLIDRRKSCR